MLMILSTAILNLLKLRKNEITKILKSLIKSFGQAYLNSSTIAGLMRILIKKLREKYKID